VLEAPAARMLDALLLGRAWIALIGVLLAGIVFFNVSLLGLNQGITRDSERAQALQQENTQLRLEVSTLASSERIQQLAAKKGMTMPVAGAVSYLRSHEKADAHRALARMEAPTVAQQQTPSAVTQSAVSTPVQTPTAAPPQTAAQPIPSGP
jgi:cell division protein FtsL